VQFLPRPAQHTSLALPLLTWVWYWQGVQVGAIRVLQVEGFR